MRYPISVFCNDRARSGPPSLTGTWQFSGDVSGNPVEIECALKQDGSQSLGHV